MFQIEKFYIILTHIKYHKNVDGTLLILYFKMLVNLKHRKGIINFLT